MSKRVLVVGAGFFGAVCARLLTDAGHRVLVVEKRNHLGGNAYTRPIPDCGGHEHVYGPHIFHCNAREIWDFVSRYTDWVPYVHRPKARYRGRIYSLPINLMTLNQIFGVTTPDEGRRVLESDRVHVENPRNLEEWCLSEIGPTLYETLIRGYTLKQWRKDPRELPSSIIKRLPVRLNYDDNYFSDRYQGIPSEGYTTIIERMLGGIPVELGTDFLADRDSWFTRFDHTIFTGSLDDLFGYSHGQLEYRSMRFESRVLDIEDFQGVAQMNETDESIPFTRTVEHKHFTLDYGIPRTLVTQEYSESWDLSKERYYPVETEENKLLHQRYKEMLINSGFPMTVGGRLGQYRYYDMHQVIGAALKTSRDLISAWS
jgi:UDP-galactopyranose mutase